MAWRSHLQGCKGDGEAPRPGCWDAEVEHCSPSAFGGRPLRKLCVNKLPLVHSAGAFGDGPLRNLSVNTLPPVRSASAFDSTCSHLVHPILHDFESDWIPNSEIGSSSATMWHAGWTMLKSATTCPSRVLIFLFNSVAAFSSWDWDCY